MAALTRPRMALTMLAAYLTIAFSTPLAVNDKIQNSNSIYPVTGAVVGGIQPRLEIRDMQANNELYSLFLLALLDFRAMSQNAKLSYFQIAGIHGQPLVDWDLEEITKSTESISKSTATSLSTFSKPISTSTSTSTSLSTEQDPEPTDDSNSTDSGDVTGQETDPPDQNTDDKGNKNTEDSADNDGGGGDDTVDGADPDNDGEEEENQDNDGNPTSEENPNDEEAIEDRTNEDEASSTVTEEGRHRNKKPKKSKKPHKDKDDSTNDEANIAKPLSKNSKVRNRKRQNNGVGYCPHGSNIFTPWHRPYLALWEQILSAKAVDIATQFPAGKRKDNYTAAAVQLRMPYWDWAKRNDGVEPILPLAFTQPTVRITFPNNTRATVENPLLLYRFHPQDPSYFGAPWNQFHYTLRNSDGRGNSVPAETESFLQAYYLYYVAQLYQVLTQYQTYNQFSNKGSDPTVLGNLEAIHDLIHGIFQDGHMSDPNVAAFDPVFWLHHAQIDRLLAIWQRLYPDTYVETSTMSNPGTWTEFPGAIENVNSPLTPFHTNTRGDFHTSATSRYTETFQYTYPELGGNPSNATLRATVNSLYAPSLLSALGQAKRQNHDIAEIPNVAVSSEQPRAYLFNIECPRLRGGYSVDVFLGPVTKAPSQWRLDPNFVGAHTTLSIVDDDKASNGSIILTEAIRKAHDDGKLADLRADTIISYLLKNLHWGVEKYGKKIERKRIRHFKIKVLSTEVKPATSPDEFPTFVGGFKELMESRELSNL